MFRVISFGFINILLLIGSTHAQSELRKFEVTAPVSSSVSSCNRHQIAAWRIGQCAANSSSMPAMSGIEMAQKPGLASRFFPAEFSDQRGNAENNSVIQSESSVGQRPATPTAPSAVAIRYVSNAGSDAEDGLSWSSAKRTIYAALISLPGGDTKVAGSGTIYVGNASSANPKTNAGIWLMGPRDPNYVSPPSGWLRCNGCTLNIIGVANAGGGPNGHRTVISLGFN
jgi:hypothetical protein